MKTIKKFIQLAFFMIVTQQSSAQIGYQVSLLNSATGEPRVAETVEVKITLTNSEGTTIHEETQTETTNDFGILSLAVGNNSTFEEVDWSKLPFFISVSVDGKLVGKSQVLTVPVAEYAKRTGILTKELLVGTWRWDGNHGASYFPFKFKFNIDGTVERWRTYDGDDDVYIFYYKYVIDGNNVAVFTDDDSEDPCSFHYYPNKQILVSDNFVLSKLIQENYENK